MMVARGASRSSIDCRAVSDSNSQPGDRVSPKKRVLILILTMAFIVVVTLTTSITLLYRAALQVQAKRLTEIVNSQARLIEAVARFDNEFVTGRPGAAMQATLSQIRDAHSKYQGFGETGEFTLSTKRNDQIVFLLSHRHYDLDQPKPVPWRSELAAPMRLALSGQSGVITGLDYRGERVLAAYEPVGELGMGIVAKIDLSEIRAPFIRAAVISGLIAILTIVLGVTLFFKVTNPILDRLSSTVEQLRKALGEVKTLRGILPICSFCKKIRDDDGYWNQVEVYVKERSDADFSHSLCPDCAQKHYDDSSSKQE